MPKITALKCPSCSAPLGTDSRRCDYCGARVEISEDGTKVVLAGVACPECSLDNEPTQRFCGGCGAALVQACPSCGETNRLGFQYCGGCGLGLREARKQVAEKLRQQAIKNGLNSVKSHLNDYMKLYTDVASPDETIILLRAGAWEEVELHEGGRPWSTGFMATDQSLYFLERSRRTVFGQRVEAVARRVPYEKIGSLTVDHSPGALIVDFESGWARVSLHPSMLLDYIKPFLPLRIQRQL